MPDQWMVHVQQQHLAAFGAQVSVEGDQRITAQARDCRNQGAGEVPSPGAPGIKTAVPDAAPRGREPPEDGRHPVRGTHRATGLAVVGSLTTTVMARRARVSV